MKSRSLLLLIQSQQDDAKKARLEAYSAALGGMDMGSAWERFYSTQTQNPSSMVRRAMHAPGEAGLRVSSEKEMKAYRPSSPTELVEGELSRFSELSGHDPLAKATNAQILGMTKHASARRHPVLTRQLLHATRPQTVPAYYQRSSFAIKLPLIADPVQLAAPYEITPEPTPRRAPRSLAIHVSQPKLPEATRLDIAKFERNLEGLRRQYAVRSPLDKTEMSELETGAGQRRFDRRVNGWCPLILNKPRPLSKTYGGF